MYNTPLIGKFNSWFKCIRTYFKNTHIKSTNLLECTEKVQELYTHNTDSIHVFNMTKSTYFGYVQ